MTPLRRLILATVAILVGMCGNPVGLQVAGGLAPNQPASVRMYWTVTMNRQQVSLGDYRAAPGQMPNNYNELQTAELKFREEYSNGVLRTVMEQGKWEYTRSDQYHHFPEGERVSGGPDAHKEGKLNLEACSAYILRIESNGEKIVQLDFKLYADDAQVKHEYFPWTLVSDPTVRIRIKLEDERTVSEISVSFDPPSFAERYTDDNITLRKWVPLDNGGETWIVQGTSPQSEPPELVLEPIGYDDWWPAGGRDEKTPGNAITVKATLRARGGGPPRYPARRVRFELDPALGSREPGVSLNWPPVDQLLAPAPFDFQIDPDRNPELRVTDDVRRQKARTADGEHLEATVVISAYDWGAFGRLRAVADLTTGGAVVGYLKGEPGRTQVLLPKRQDDSRIADRWKERADAANLADDSDADDDPVGNGFKGDGLSLYEEYRGFHEQGEHICGVPKKKDLFLLDEIGTPFSRQGITLFETVSGLKVHHRLRDSELKYEHLTGDVDNGRVVNLNHKSAHLVDQHALVLTEEDPGSGLAGRAVGGPGVPRKVQFLFLHPDEVQFFPQYSHAATLAHEMLHGVNVWHHGELDRWVEWRMGDYAGKPCVYETSTDDNGDPEIRRVRVYRKVGSSRDLVPPETFRTGMKLWVAARQGGQHSGQKKCLMTYTCASAVAGRQMGDFHERTLVGVPPRETLLCDSPQGTSHFGDANSAAAEGPSQRGACTKQICVNDKYQGP